MRISDWSSDVCSSDLADLQANRRSGRTRRTRGDDREPRGCDDFGRPACCAGARCAGQGQLRTRAHALRSESDGPCRPRGGATRLCSRGRDSRRRDRKSGVWGRSVVVRVERGVRSIIKKKKKKTATQKKK